MKVNEQNKGSLMSVFVTVCVLAILCMEGIPAYAQPKVLVGITQGVTGACADPGRSSRDAIIMGIEEWNNKGGIRGHKVDYIFRDNACDPSKATTIAKEFVRRQVVAAFGAVTSTVGIPEAQVLVPENIPFMGGSASRKLWDYKGKDGKSYYFSFCGSDPVHAAGILACFAELGFKKLAIAYLNVAWPQDIFQMEVELMKKKYGPEYGMSLVGTVEVDAKAMDLSKEVAMVKSMKPDAVVTNMYGANYAAWFRACADLDYHPPTIGVWGLLETAYLSMDPRLLYNSYGYNYFSPKKKEAMDALKRFKDRWGYEPVSHWSFAYQEARTLFTAMEAVGFEGPKIRDYIASKMKGTPIILGHEKSTCFFQEGTPYFYSVFGPEDWAVVYINKNGEKVWLK